MNIFYNYLMGFIFVSGVFVNVSEVLGNVGLCGMLIGVVCFFGFLKFIVLNLNSIFLVYVKWEIVFSILVIIVIFVVVVIVVGVIFVIMLNI